jgi:hypothetical protein
MQYICATVENLRCGGRWDVSADGSSKSNDTGRKVIGNSHMVITEVRTLFRETCWTVYQENNAILLQFIEKSMKSVEQ